MMNRKPTLSEFLTEGLAYEEIVILFQFLLSIKPEQLFNLQVNYASSFPEEYQKALVKAFPHVDHDILNRVPQFALIYLEQIFAAIEETEKQIPGSNASEKKKLHFTIDELKKRGHNITKEVFEDTKWIIGSIDYENDRWKNVDLQYHQGNYKETNFVYYCLIPWLREVKPSLGARKVLIAVGDRLFNSKGKSKFINEIWSYHLELMLLQYRDQLKLHWRVLLLPYFDKQGYHSGDDKGFELLKHYIDLGVNPLDDGFIIDYISSLEKIHSLTGRTEAKQMAKTAFDHIFKKRSGKTKPKEYQDFISNTVERYKSETKERKVLYSKNRSLYNHFKQLDLWRETFSNWFPNQKEYYKYLDWCVSNYKTILSNPIV